MGSVVTPSESDTLPVTSVEDPGGSANYSITSGVALRV